MMSDVLITPMIAEFYVYSAKVSVRLGNNYVLKR
jgi:hypothetical protein